MKRKSLPSIFVCALAFAVVSVLNVNAQNFQKSYQLGPGGSISVKNVSGDIEIKGSDTPAVSVTAIKEGRDADKVEVVDLSSGNRVELEAKYPRDCQCEASLKFQINVPRSLNVNIDRVTVASGDVSIDAINGKVQVKTASGDVKVSNINGDVDASTASGDVRVTNVVGTVNARSASGDVEAQIAGLPGPGDMRFQTASGDVKVTMPANVDATVKMSTVSGSIKTDFPLDVRKHEHGPGSEANGTLGAGSRNIQLSSASGDVTLSRQ